jgi:nicotinamidase/pyrazinamidase
MRIGAAGDILGLVDVQPTFMPGGELPVVGGDEIVPLVNRLLEAFPRAFATQDWHPVDHISFASQHAGHQPFETISLPYGEQVLWPDHAIAASANAAIHSGIDQRKVEVIIRKGADRLLDSYSAFYENDRTTPTGLDGWLRQRGYSRLFLCGLATDFCVAWSAEDAVRHGYEVIVIEDACRGIALPAEPGMTTVDVARARLTEMGVRFTTTDAIT